MKSITFVSVASYALSALAAPSVLDARQEAAWDAAPQGQRLIPRLDSQAIIDGAKRTEVLYGPYTVPAGKMVTKNNLRAKSPCTNCYVTAMRATLKYPDGREALVSDGAWLHHTALAAGTGALWAAGNERPTIRLNQKYKYGIDWPASFFYTLDIMSEKKEAMNVSMSITYEHIDKASAQGKLYKAAVMRWLQIGNPMPVAGQTVYKNTVSSAPVNGKLLYTIGHMHDGGTNLRLLVNGKTACNSVMFYDKAGVVSKATGPNTLLKRQEHSHGAATAPAPAPAAASGGEGHSHGMPTFGGIHIAHPGSCTNYGDIKKGDQMQIEAYYDFSGEYSTMMHEGKAEALMGNCRVYIGPE